MSSNPLHVCFYCDRRFGRLEKFIICTVCYGFRACESCYTKNGNATGWNVDKMERRRALLLALDRLRSPSKVEHDGLEAHEFTMEHANWDTELGESDFAVADSTYWDESAQSGDDDDEDDAKPSAASSSPTCTASAKRAVHSTHRAH
jgi:hypothetical protein